MLVFASYVLQEINTEQFIVNDLTNFRCCHFINIRLSITDVQLACVDVSSLEQFSDSCTG